MLIPLRDKAGKVVAGTRVDPETFDLLNAWRWSLGSGGYAVRGERKRGRNYAILMHRFILGLPAEDRRQGDHINGDRLDNRRANLRRVSLAENRQNRVVNRNSKSGYRGVHWDERDQKWLARVQVNGKRVALGRYDDPVEAAEIAAAYRAEHMAGSREALER